MGYYDMCEKSKMAESKKKKQKQTLRTSRRCSLSITQKYTLTHIVLMSFVFGIEPTDRAVLASYTMVVPARLHDQCTGANSQSELVVPNWLSLYTVPHAHS